MQQYQFTNLRIETTSICNSACAVCPREEFYNQRVTTMPMELFKKVAIDLHDNRVTGQVRFSGMGDASCDKMLLERLRWMKERTPALKVMILSNMAVWKNAYTDAIVEEGLIEVQRFSLFAASDTDSVRAYGKPGQWEKARAAIDYYVEKNASAGRPIKLSVYTLIEQDNATDVARIKERYWDAVEEFEIWRPHSWANLMPHLRDVTSNRRRCHRVDNLEGSIRVNGDLCVCSMDINHTLVLGNMANQTFKEIYEGEPYRKLKAINVSGALETIPTCKNCSFLNVGDDVFVESKAHWRQAV